LGAAQTLVSQGHRQALYTALLLSGKLDAHLTDANDQSERMISELVKQMAQRQGVNANIHLSHNPGK
jgi:hypothetical protein